MKLDRQKKIVLGVVLGVLLFVVLVVMVGRGGTDKTSKSEDLLPTESVIPTVGSDVKVTLVTSSAGREVTLQINGIPTGTTAVDYELSYQTNQQGLQGVIGTVEVNEGEDKIAKSLTLGTCSSGTCIYHQVLGKIRLNLRFSGEYGEKVFENKFEL